MDKKLIFNENGDRGTQSMIGGNTTNLREWNRIKYDWANQMYRTMLNNFWIPEEISLNEDVKQFPYLTDYERRAFDKIIAFLNFLDSIQSENLPNLSRYITASEVASLLNIQEMCIRDRASMAPRIAAISKPPTWATILRTR